MHTDVNAARRLAEGVVARTEGAEGVQVAVCPPFVNVQVVHDAVAETPVRLGAQHMHNETEGAFTGEVSAPMLRAVGCRYVILGHSERRQHFGETDEDVRRKVEQAIAHELVPIVCVGETLEARKAGRQEEVIRAQVQHALDGVSLGDSPRLVLAYEPVWAIGTGESATPEQAQAMHAFIRKLIVGQHGEAAGGALHILYGGSMKPHNAEALLGQPDVNGGLIGGASLQAEDFAAIVEVAERIVAGEARPASRLAAGE